MAFRSCIAIMTILTIECLLRVLCESTNSCSGGLMSQLKEIRRDIRHANRTIDTEKLSTSMSDKLYELEDAYRDHFIGFKNSHESYARSIDNLSSTFKLNKLNLTGVDIIYFVDTLESHKNLVEEDYKRQSIATENIEMTYFYVHERQQALLGRHITLISHINYIDSTLDNINQEENVNLTSLSKAIEEQLIKHSESEIADQVSGGVLLKAIYDNALEKFTSIDEILFEFRNYRYPQAVELVKSRLLRLRGGYSLSFTDNLYQITQKVLDCSRNSSATKRELSEIGRSLNNSLESSEHLYTNKLGNDLQMLKKDLDGLSSRLKYVDNEVYKLQYALNSIGALKNSTQELSKINSDMHLWVIDQLIPTEQDLSSIHDYYMNQTHKLTEWTNLLSLPESIDQIEANLHQVNLIIDQLFVEIDA